MAIPGSQEKLNFNEQVLIIIQHCPLYTSHLLLVPFNLDLPTFYSQTLNLSEGSQKVEVVIRNACYT